MRYTPKRPRPTARHLAGGLIAAGTLGVAAAIPAAAEPAATPALRLTAAVCEQWSFVAANPKPDVTELGNRSIDSRHGDRLRDGEVTRPVSLDELPAGCRIVPARWTLGGAAEAEWVWDADEQAPRVISTITGGPVVVGSGLHPLAGLAGGRWSSVADRDGDGDELWVGVEVPAYHSFAALRCGVDAMNNDNAEEVFVDGFVGGVQDCVAYFVAPTIEVRLAGDGFAPDQSATVTCNDDPPVSVRVAVGAPAEFPVGQHLSCAVWIDEPADSVAFEEGYGTWVDPGLRAATFWSPTSGRTIVTFTKHLPPAEAEHPAPEESEPDAPAPDTPAPEVTAPPVTTVPPAPATVPPAPTSAPAPTTVPTAPASAPAPAEPRVSSTTVLPAPAVEADAVAAVPAAAEPAPEAPAETAVAAPSGDTLPRTGNEVLPMAAAGAVIAGLGAVLAGLGRRRRTA